MAKKNRFDKIKGTKDFLIMAVACAFLCLWSIRDAWFPTKKILEKHPQSYPVTVAVPGVVQTIPVKVGEEVSGARPLLTLATQAYKEAVDAAEAVYRAATESKPGDLQAELDALLKAKADLRSTTVSCTDFMLETTHGTDPLHGDVLQILVEPATHVDAGQTVMLIKPSDTFYAFNKTLAMLSFAGFIAALIFHRIASL